MYYHLLLPVTNTDHFSVHSVTLNICPGRGEIATYVERTWVTVLEYLADTDVEKLIVYVRNRWHITNGRVIAIRMPRTLVWEYHSNTFVVVASLMQQTRR